MSFPVSLSSALATADHMDALKVESDIEFQPFLNGLLAFDPRWLQLLYRLRYVLLSLFGHRTGVPDFSSEIKVVPRQVGARVGFFEVEDSGPEHWMAVGRESHLTARLVVIRSPGVHRRYSYKLVTVVHYHNLLGRLYFAVIQPFHYFVVRAMLRSAAQSALRK